MSSNNWRKRLATRLNALNESSSKESAQTLANWIGFNRKHMTASFLPLLQSTVLQAKTAALQVTYLSVLHEVLILDKDNTTKWERMEEMRVTLGENLLLKVVSQLQEPARDKLKTIFLKEWDDASSFGGPTLINEIRKKISASSTSAAAAETGPATPEEATPSPTAKPTTTPAAEPTANSKDSSPANKDMPEKAAVEDPMDIEKDEKMAAKDTVSQKDDKDKASNAAPPKPENITRRTSNITTTYDFESTGIPATKVDPKMLLEPTRSIASLQIARDLRNDGAVQLSSLISNLPDNIKQSCQDKEELSADKARDFAMRTPDVLIDMDLEEQLQSIRMYRDIVKQQRTARKQLIRALIQSRCQFGANDAAEAFETAHRARGQLLKRKQSLMDAMELEGLDVSEEEKNMHSEDTTEFAPLEWYKKAKTDETST